jgi:hypothetical protein
MTEQNVKKLEHVSGELTPERLEEVSGGFLPEVIAAWAVGKYLDWAWSNASAGPVWDAVRGMPGMGSFQNP